MTYSEFRATRSSLYKECPTTILRKAVTSSCWCGVLEAITFLVRHREISKGTWYIGQKMNSMQWNAHRNYYMNIVHNKI